MANEELGASELGTLEYWEDRYKDEIKNFLHSGDPGEIWFGEDIVDRIIDWLSKNVEKSSKVVDLGCGNGHILIELAQMGYEHLTGLDYSERAINLAKAITDKQKLHINYEVNDILEGLSGAFDVIHDKGTYDAVSLSQHAKESQKKYVENVKAALENTGYFVITSCNWTQRELKEQFKDHFDLFQVIPTPQFRFGGKVGNVVSICVFKKKQ